MAKKIKIRGSRIRKTNFKAVTFFLIFSCVIWLFVQFSKTYQEIIQIPISYSEIPKDKIISHEKKHLEVRLEDTGFGLAWFSLFRNRITLNLTELPADEDEIIFSTRENALEISDKLGVNLSDIDFLTDTLKIPFQQKETKRVPVVSRIKISFKPGYGTSDSLRISPDTIMVSGPKNTLDSLQLLTTKDLKLKEVDKNLNGTVAIDSSNLENITLYDREVTYSLKVEKFTEGKLEVPLFVVNAPENMDLVIFPKTTSVVFQVSLENYKHISKSDFKVVCDYKDLEEGQEYFIPKVTKKPENISNLRIGTKKVQFVVKK